MVPKFLLALALAISVTSMAEDARAEGPPEIGRYQISINERGGIAVLIDTVTGRSWILASTRDRQWSDLSFGKMKNGHEMFTPPLCTEANPTCYFALPKSGDESAAAQKPAESTAAPKPAEGDAVH